MIASEERDLFTISYQVNRRRQNLAKKRATKGKREFRSLSNIIITKLTEAINTTDKPHLNTAAIYCRSTIYFQKSFQRVGEGSVYKDLFHLAETVVSIPLLRFQRQEDYPLP